MSRQPSVGRFSRGPPTQSKKFLKAQTKAANPLNQYFLDNFAKLKRDADFKGITHVSQCYRKVIASLAKYPLPILCAQ